MCFVEQVNYIFFFLRKNIHPLVRNVIVATCSNRYKIYNIEVEHFFVQVVINSKDTPSPFNQCNDIALASGIYFSKPSLPNEPCCCESKQSISNVGNTIHYMH